MTKMIPLNPDDRDDDLVGAHGHRDSDRQPNGLRWFTDLGNAERLVDTHGHRIRFNHDRRQWLIWDDTRWRPDRTGEIHRLAAETVRSIFDEITAVPVDMRDKDLFKAITKHAKSSEGKTHLKAMVEIAQTIGDVPVIDDDLDRDEWALNFANGTLDLRTAHLREHRQADLITKVIDVDYDSEAKAPRWEKFMAEVLPDEEERQFVQRAAGYSLTGSTMEQVMFLLFGDGENGKTVFVEALLKSLGDYGYSASSELMLQQKRSSAGASPDLAALQGRRMIATTETDEGKRLAEGLVKRLTGQDTVNARRLYADPFEFKMQGKIWLATNSKPLITGQNHAIWRRILPVHFAQKFDGVKRDRSLAETLHRERAGILRWAVAGCRAWLANEGLTPPVSVLAERDEYREEQDTLGQFLRECCIHREGAMVETEHLWDEYKGWAQGAGLAAGSKQAFVRKVKERGYPNARLRENGRQASRFYGLDLAANHPIKVKKKPRPRA